MLEQLTLRAHILVKAAPKSASLAFLTVLFRVNPGDTHVCLPSYWLQLNACKMLCMQRLWYGAEWLSAPPTNASLHLPDHFASSLLPEVQVPLDPYPERPTICF